MSTRTSTMLLLGGALALTIAGCSTAPKEQAPAPVAAPAPAPAPMPAPAPPPPPPPAPSFVIEDVNFDFDKSTLKPGAVATLDNVADELKNQGGVGYEVAGFTDSVGTEAYNQGLSERRANAVADYLVQQGVSRGQLTVRGYGESNPVASNADSAGRAQNRRVEVRPLR